MFFIACCSVFGFTLLVTKSKVLACKRQFVEERYKASKANDHKPMWIHRIWHAGWTCPMCLGVYVSAVLCLTVCVSPLGWFWNVCALAGVNWLLHCLERVFFFIGEFLEKDLIPPSNDV